MSIEATMFKRFFLSLVVLSLLSAFAFASTDALQPLGCQLSSRQISAASYQLEFTFSIVKVSSWVDGADIPAPTRWIAVPPGTEPMVIIIEREVVAIPKTSQKFLSIYIAPSILVISALVYLSAKERRDTLKTVKACLYPSRLSFYLFLIIFFLS